ncbi:P-loop NTPase fold protein [Enterococcus hirae]
MNNLKDVINNYLDSEEPYALQIDGEWGVGKTYFMKNQVVKKLKDDNNFAIYFSVYGYDSLKQIQQEILFSIVSELHPSKKLITQLSRANKGLNSFLSKFGNSKLQSISLLSDAILELIDNKFTPINNKEINHDKSFVIIIDDLERLSRKIELSDFLGFIGNELLEKLNCKVIILSNISEIKNYKNFKKIREKTIYRTVKFKYSVSLIEEMLLKESKNIFIRENSNWISSILEINETAINVRSLMSVIDNYNVVESKLSEELEQLEFKNIIDAKKSIFLNIYVITIEYKSGTINEKNLQEINKLTKIENYYLDFLDDQEDLIKSLIKKYHNKNQDFDKYIFYSEDINEFVLFGYLNEANFITEWSEKFIKEKELNSFNKVGKLWNFRDLTDLQLKSTQEDILDDIKNDKYDLDELITAYGQLYQFDKMGLNFLDANYSSIIELKIVNEYTKLAKNKNITVKDKIELNPQINIKEKKPELYSQLEYVDKQLNKERLTEFINILFSDNHSKFEESKEKVMGLKSNIIKQMLEEDNISKYIVTENNKAHNLGSLIDSNFFGLYYDTEELELFISVIKKSMKNKTLGKIDEFKINQLIDSLNNLIQNSSRAKNLIELTEPKE